MGDKQWLQCTIPTPDWETINQQRAKLSLKWADLMLPAVKTELDRLEAQAAKARELTATTSTPKGKGKGTRRRRKEVKSLRCLARELQVSPAYLSQVVHGKKNQVPRSLLG